MGREAKVFWDATRKGWTTSAIGAERTGPDGKVYRLKVTNRELGPKDKKGAQAWLAAELAKLEAKTDPVPAGVPLFGWVAESFLCDAERTKRMGSEARTRAAEHLKRFYDYPAPDSPQRMELLPINRITPDHLKGYTEALLTQGLSESYVADGLLKTVRSCFTWAVAVRADAYAGLPIASNPIAGFKPPAKPRRAQRVVSEDQVDAFFRWYWQRMTRLPGLNGRFAKIGGILLLTLRATGARPKEICSATWDDWSLRADGMGIIRLPWQRWKNGKKTRQMRLILVPPRCARRIEWIRRLPDRHPTAIFVHRRERGTATGRAATCPEGQPFVADYDTDDTKGLQTWFYRVKNQAIEAKVPLPPEFRLYWFRSLYSTEAQRRGLNSPFLAKAMGTSEAMLDRHYTDADLEDIATVATGMTARRPPKPTP